MKKHPNIGHYLDFQEPDNHTYKGSDELLSIGSPIGKKLGLQRTGVHIEVLKPGRRTSWPHAEKDEEEYVYVIKGKVDAWLDGELYPMTEGMFVAFPSGTGIAHTIINNYSEDAKLLVGGESIQGCQVFYPFQPERNEEIKKQGRLWENCPDKKLSPEKSIPKKR
jgi:uncharacterized cupin superfamily protein